MAYLGFSCCCGFGLALFNSFAIWLRRRQNWMYPLSCPGVEAVPLPVCRGVELEEPELDRGLREGRVVVEQHMVPAVVVVGAAVVARAVACVPDVRELLPWSAASFLLSCSRKRGSTVRQ